MEEVDYLCMRCGNEYRGPFDKLVPVERSCPKCNSNSIRRNKKKPKKPTASA